MNCRLLYLVGQLGVGGLERQLYYLLQTMDRERYKPAVVVWNYCEEDAYLQQIREFGVPVYSFSGKVSPSAKLRALRHMIRELEPELLHSYSFYTNFAGYWATRYTRVVVVGSIRNELNWSKKEEGPWLGRLSARWPRNQIYNTCSAAETTRSSHSFFIPKRFSVVHNGLDLEMFQSSPLSAHEKVYILGVGSLCLRKRWDRLLLAVVELKQMGIDCSIRIAGEGPLLGSLIQQAQELGIEKHVEFLGHSNDVPSLLADSRLLAHTSDNEGCPNAVMEAMACGRAVVAMDAGDIPYLVEDGKTGFVVGREDITKFVKRVMTLITDVKLCRRMGEAGRLKAEREFRLDRLVKETLAAYRSAGWKDN